MGVLRDSDNSWYMREEAGGLLLGPYEKGAPCCYVDGPSKDSEYELFQEDLDRLAPHIEGAIAAERENVISYFAQAGLITLALNVVMMIVAYFVAQLLASGTKQKKCITIECGLQNGTLAIFVATSIFGGGMYVIPAATYSLIMFATSLIFVYLVRKAI